MNDDVTELTVPPDLGALAEIRRFVGREAQRAGFPESRIYDITVAVSEAASNAVEHSSTGDRVAVRATRKPDRLEFHVFGPGEFRLPDRGQPRAYRGLGLPMMAALSDHVALYSGTDGGTLVVLTFYDPGHSPAPGGPLPPIQKELLEDNLLLSEILSSAPVGMSLVGSDLRLKWVNPNYRALLDEPLRSADLEGVFVGDLVPPEVREAFVSLIKGVSETGEPFAVEEYAYDGMQRGRTYWNWRMVPLRGPGQEPPYELLSLVLEVTHAVLGRQRLEAERGRLQATVDLLRASEERFAKAFVGNRSALAIMVLPEGRYLDVNPAFLSTTGYERDELIGRTPEEVGISVDREVYETWLESQSVEGGSFESEGLFRRKDGALRTYRGWAQEIEVDGRSCSLVGIEDTTERRDAEIRLRMGLDRERRRRRLAETLGEVNRVLVGSGGSEAPFDSVLEQGMKGLNAEWAAVVEPDGPGWSVLFAAGDSPLLPSRVVREGQAHGLRALLEANELVTWGAEASDGGTESAGIFGSRLLLSVPLRRAQGACLLLLGCSVGRACTDLEKDFVRELAATLSLALDNARLNRERQSVGETLQEALFVPPRPVSGLLFATQYRSADDAAQVGGDFYDVFTLSGGYVALLIGDVSGHGVRAATFASLVRETIRAHAFHERSPRHIMRLTNGCVTERPEFEGFVSVFLGLLETGTGHLRYCLAGHPPPLLSRGDGQARAEQWVTSPPLGFLPDARFRTGRTRLHMGDLLLLYTDGVTEARRGREHFGEDRLQEIVERGVDSPAALLDSVMGDLDRFVSGSYRDDLAMLAVRLANGAGETGAC